MSSSDRSARRPSQSPAPALARARRTALWLAAIAFVVYNANLRSIASADTFPARYLPISILREGDLDLDEFAFLQTDRFPMPDAPPGSGPYFMQLRRGHWMSTYPVAPAIVAAPVYALPVLLGVDRGPPIGALTRTEVVGTFLAKIAASLLVAASVAVMYLVFLRYVGRTGALALALIYAFATSSWSVSSQGLWQSAISQPALALGVYALLRVRERPGSRGWAATAGTALALSAAARPPMLLFAAVMTVYVVVFARRSVFAFLAPALAIGVLLVSYNLYYFGTLVGGYVGRTAAYRFTPAQMWLGVRGLLLSPSRGLFVFSPILLLGIVGAARALAPTGWRLDPLLASVALGTVISVLLYTAYEGWHGAFGFSYRLLSELLPGLVLLLVPVWTWLTATLARRAATGALVAYSVLVQIVGAFFFPCGWYQSPRGNAAALQRFFSWRDSEILTCLEAGPVDPDGLRAIRAALHIRGGGRVAQ